MLTVKIELYKSGQLIGLSQFTFDPARPEDARDEMDRYLEYVLDKDAE